VFTSTAVRDTQWPSPPNGACCVTTDTGTFWQRAGTTWWTPFKRIVYASRSSSITTVAEAIAVTTPAVAFPSGRLVRVAGGWYNIGVGTANEGCIIRIREGAALGGTQLTATVTILGGAGPMIGIGNGGVLEASYSPAVGSRQWSLTVAATGAANTPVNGAAGQPIWLGVWDAGSA
jgi:hypothetical protein